MLSSIVAALVASLQAHFAVWFLYCSLEYLVDVAVLSVEVATLAGVTRDVVYGAVAVGIILSWGFA